MTADRKHSSAAFWATAVVVVTMVYIAGFGPAYGIMSRDECPPWLRRSIIKLYRPCFLIADYGDGPIRDALAWYAEQWR